MTESMTAKAPTTSGFVDFHGMKVWYHVAGPLPTVDGPPLLLHGDPL